jgi:hypothetical protein
MKLFAVLFSVFSIISSPVFAAEAPFSWPETNSFKLTETNADDKNYRFTGIYYASGNNFRSEVDGREDGLKTSIVRLDEQKEILIYKDGRIEEKTIASDTPKSNFFPRNAEWKKLGTDKINGKKAVKYEVSDAKRIVTMWLTPDNKTPLRMEDGPQVIEWSNYSTKPIDPKLFTLQTN